MVANLRRCAWLLAAGSAACSGGQQFVTYDIREVYSDDFTSDDPKTCTLMMADLSHAQAAEFFKRARGVDSKTLHDHYLYAPCRVEGTLVYRGKKCDWQITPARVATVDCEGRKYFFVCDACADLYPKEE